MMHCMSGMESLEYPRSKRNRMLVARQIAATGEAKVEISEKKYSADEVSSAPPPKRLNAKMSAFAAQIKPSLSVCAWECFVL